MGDNSELIFEFPVPVQKGTGKPSYTDLAILTSDCFIGIEAKYTEPKYESVSSWLGPAPSENRKAVLQGWIDLLNRVSTTPLDALTVSGLPYQLIHRAASACFLDRKKRVLVYLVFGTAVAPHYCKHASELESFLGHEGLSIRVLTCETTPSAVCQGFVQRWKAGDRALSGEIRAALLRAPLYSFGAISVVDRPAA